MTTRLAIILILVNYLTILIRKPFISPILLWNLNTNLSIVGFAQICDVLGRPPGWFLILATPLMFSLASWIQVPKNLNVSLNDTEVRAIKKLFLIIVMVSFYHFYRIGIPAFSGNSETARFTSISDSGLFGLPGRIVLFGIPIFAILVVIKRQDFSKYFLGCVAITWVVSRIFLGFKGGILEILVLVAIALSSSEFKFKARTAFYFLMCLLVSSSYALWVGGRYQSLSGKPLNLEYFLQRVTRGAALPQWTSLDQGAWLSSNINPVLIDFQYFMSKYFGIGNQDNLTFDKLVSTYIYDTPRSLSAFIVPVTIGGTAYLVSSFGYVFAPILILAFGFIYAYTTSRIISFGMFRLVLAVAVLLGIIVFFSNGNLIYVMINYGVTWILFSVLLKLFVSLKREVRINEA